MGQGKDRKTETEKKTLESQYRNIAYGYNIAAINYNCMII